MYIYIYIYTYIYIYIYIYIHTHTYFLYSFISIIVRINKETANLVTFTEETLNGKLFLCSVYSLTSQK